MDAIASAFGAADFATAFADAFAALVSDANGLTTGQSPVAAPTSSVAETEGVNASPFVSAVSVTLAASNASLDQKLTEDGVPQI